MSGNRNEKPSIEVDKLKQSVGSIPIYITSTGGTVREVLSVPFGSTGSAYANEINDLSDATHNVVSNILYLGEVAPASADLGGCEHLIVLGTNALQNIEGGPGYNIAIGQDSLQLLTTGSGNIAIGDSAGLNILGGENNILLGNDIHGGDHATDVIAIGHDIIVGMSSSKVVAIGDGIDLSGLPVGGVRTEYYITDTAQEVPLLTTDLRLIGFDPATGQIGPLDVVYPSGGVAAPTSLNLLTDATSTEFNMYIGAKAPLNSDYDISIGTGALSQQNNLGCVAVGVDALQSATGTYGNVAVGLDAMSELVAGNRNIAVGVEAGKALLTGSNNIFIGSGESMVIDNGDSTNVICIGNNLVIPSGATHRLYVDPDIVGALSSGKKILTFDDNSGQIAPATDIQITGSIVGHENISFGNTNAIIGSDNIALGHGNMTTLTDTATDNVALGFNALHLLSTGQNNVAIGQNALATNDDGNNNIAIGINSLEMSTGNSNIALGGEVLSETTIGSENIGIGQNTLWLNTTGNQNVGIGVNTLKFVKSGSKNVAIGFDTAKNLETGSHNIIIGYNNTLQSGAMNSVVLGYDVDVSGIAASTTPKLFMTSGLGDVGVSGNKVMMFNVTTGQIGPSTTVYPSGTMNFANLVETQFDGTTNNENIAIGHKTLLGTNNVALGALALNSTVNATVNNVAIGYNALNANEGDNNVAIGYSTLQANTSGMRNVAVGLACLASNTDADNNIAIGANTLQSNSIGDNNIAIGFQAATSNDGNGNIAIGTSSMLNSTTAVENIAIGQQAIMNVEGTRNICVGEYSGQALTSGQYNIIVGDVTAVGLSIGDNNIVLGRNNTMNADSNKAIVIGDGLNISAEPTDAVPRLYVAPTLDTVVESAGRILMHNTTTGKIGPSNPSISRLADAEYSTVNSNVYIGHKAPAGTNSNVAIGDGVLTQIDATRTIAIGVDTAKNATDCHDNIALGIDALLGATYVTGTIAIGHLSAQSVGAALNEEVAIGNESMYSYVGDHDVSGHNTAIGHFALHSFSSGANNVAIGYNSAQSMISGDGNVIVGSNTVLPVESQNTTIIGNDVDVSSQTLTDGSRRLFAHKDTLAQTFTGKKLMVFDTTTGQMGPANAVYPSGTMYFANLVDTQFDGTVGSENIAIGHKSLTGTNNVAIGINTMTSSVNDTFGNVAIGNNAMKFAAAGAWMNVAVGPDALKNNEAGVRNIAIGNSSLLNTTSNDNIAIGGEALQSNTTSQHNIAIGYSSSGILSAGESNISIGVLSLGSTTSSTQNIAVGENALRYVTNNYNTCIGHDSGVQIKNSANNTIVGYNTAKNLSTGGLNIVIGAGNTLHSGASEVMVLGNNLNLGNVAPVNVPSLHVDPDLSQVALSGNKVMMFDIATGKMGPANAVYPSGTMVLDDLEGVTNNVDTLYISQESPAGNTQCVVLGTGSLQHVSNVKSVVVGVDAAISASGSGNTFVGYNAAKVFVSGSHNVAIGESVAATLQSGDNNAFFGANIVTPVDCSNTTIIGNNVDVSALTTLSDGTKRLFIDKTIETLGFASNKLLVIDETTGQIGRANAVYPSGTMVLDDLTGVTNSVDTLYVGQEAPANAGTKNVVLGTGSLQLESNSSSVVVGYNALLTATGTIKNIAIGHEAGKTLVTGSNNIFIGDGESTVIDGGNVENVIALGNNLAIPSGTTPKFFMTAGLTPLTDMYQVANERILLFNTTTGQIGPSTTTKPLTLHNLYDCNNSNKGLFIGNHQFGTGRGGVPTYNLGIAPGALNLQTDSSTEHHNIAIGENSLNILNNGFVQNNAIGNYSMHVLVTGAYNTSLGHESLRSMSSGSSNIALGYKAGSTLVTGSNNIFIGTSGSIDAGYVENVICIGNNLTISSGTTHRIFTNPDVDQLSFTGRKLMVFDETTGQIGPANAVYPSGGGGATSLNGLSDCSITGTNAISIGQKFATNSHENTVKIGFNNLTNELWGFQNTAIGTNIFQSLQTSYANIGIGSNIAPNYTGGTYLVSQSNVLIGDTVASNTINGGMNVMIGYSCGGTKGDRNVIVGQYANSNGNAVTNDNVFIGTSAGRQNIGSENIALGLNALYGGINATGGNNIAIGKNSMGNLTTGANNIAIGNSSTFHPGGSEIITLGNNINVSNVTSQVPKFFMTSALDQIAYVDPTVRLMGFNLNTGQIGPLSAVYPSGGGGGATSLNGLTDASLTGTGNIAIGYKYPTNNGTYNIGLGYQTLNNLTAGANNFGAGYHALVSCQNGSNNIAFGTGAMRSATSAASNIAMGYDALKSVTTSSHNIALGYETLKSNTLSTNNVAIGPSALTVFNPSPVGTDYYNVAIGTNSMFDLVHGKQNIALGLSSMNTITTGAFNICIGNSISLPDNTSNIIALGNSISSADITSTSTPKLYMPKTLTTMTYVDPTIRLMGFNTSNGHIGPLDAAYSAGATSLDGLTDASMTGTFNIRLGSKFPNTVVGGYNFAVGDVALNALTSGYNNIALGRNSLWLNTTGYDNFSAGAYNMLQNTTGYSNISIGNNALRTNTTGAYNIAIGFSALFNNTIGVKNVCLGYLPMQYQLGNNNVALGIQSLYGGNTASTTGTNNIAIGEKTSYSSQDASYNISFGSSALYTNISGNNNVAIGTESLFSTFTGASNCAIGYRSLYSNTVGTNNIAFGSGAMFSNTTGITNIAIGQGSMGGLTTGANNIAIGKSSTFHPGGSEIITLGNNINVSSVNSTTPKFFMTSALGQLAISGNRFMMFNASDGQIGPSTSSGLGLDDLTDVLYSNSNLVIGRNSTNASNTVLAICSGALASVDSSAVVSLAIGFEAAFSCVKSTNNVVLGHRAMKFHQANSAGNAYNVIIGTDAILNYTSNSGLNRCTIIGDSTCRDNTAIGDDTVCVGNGAGYIKTTFGQGNVILGGEACYSSHASSSVGAQNVFIGYKAGYRGNSATTYGGGNVIIGAFAGTNPSSLGNDNIIIGNNGGADTGYSNQCRIGKIYNTTITSIHNVGISDQGQLGVASSSRKTKENIAPIPDIITEHIYDLESVSFNYIFDTQKTNQVGMIAEDVDVYFSTIVPKDSNNECITINYEKLPVFMLPEMKKLRNRIVDLETTVTSQQTTINTLLSTLQQLQTDIANLKTNNNLV